MEKKDDILMNTALFAGIAPENAARLLRCIHGRETIYRANSRIIEEGDRVSAFGILLAGCGRVVKTDDAGRVILIAQKGLMLHERIDCLLRPTVRGKILACLEKAGRGRESAVITLPFDRNGMAEYLNVERSALSRELSAMRRDGLIDYRKNVFRVL